MVLTLSISYLWMRMIFPKEVMHILESWGKPYSSTLLLLPSWFTSGIWQRVHTSFFNLNCYSLFLVARGGKTFQASAFWFQNLVLFPYAECVLSSGFVCFSAHLSCLCASEVYASLFWFTFFFFFVDNDWISFQRNAKKDYKRSIRKLYQQ